jgi:2'-5' RNA ligase
MEQIRAFIAIELPRSLRLALSRLQERLKPGIVAPVKWVEPENTHLTLKFLGNIDAAITADIVKAITAAARTTPPVRLGLAGLGAFPDSNRVQVVWVGLTGEMEKLRALQQRLDAALAPLSIPGEKRPFSPHLTIARLRDRATLSERQAVGRLIAEAGLESGPGFSAGSVQLMRSRLTPQGPVYSRLGSVGLGG